MYLDWLQNLTSYRCNLELRNSMCAPPRNDEIVRIIMKQNSNKALGPDGFTSGFFKED